LVKRRTPPVCLRESPISEASPKSWSDNAPFHPVPTQLPRPPLGIAAQATGSLRIAVRDAEAVVCPGDPAKGIDESLSGFRDRMTKLDELCLAEGRDPARN
jgi:alkanesulfonate monooxygenase SsuD/methylene tetrahydromethanopterin reductase-like flavin-dependent oxidoreductase (luciferase family)